MFCNQCQETFNSIGCTKNRVCGKKGEVADLQDKLIYVLKSISFYNLKARAAGLNEGATDRFVLDAFFATLTIDGTEMDVELLRKLYAAKRTKVLEAATIKLRAVALGR
jgi:hydroxylamine reductase